ncbi:hypothetical protein [Castellaniella sp.]|uniref:hypothetical protein n=1 Tax=Castellaniella sp. TaxID=1955812 RepID=UPI003A9124E7
MLIVPMLMAGSGIALTVPTMTNATLSSVDASRAGIASGVLNSARQIGGMPEGDAPLAATEDTP